MAGQIVYSAPRRSIATTLALTATGTAAFSAPGEIVWICEAAKLGVKYVNVTLDPRKFGVEDDAGWEYEMLFGVIAKSW